MKLSDEKDIIAIIHDPENKNKAFDLIVKKYGETLYFHIRRMVIDHEDANDLLQDTFCKAYENIHNFRAESAIYTWLYRIATNTTLNFLNQKKRLYIFSVNNYSEILASKLESDPYFSGDDIQKIFHKAILKLPPKQQLVFNMKYFENIKYEDMAEILSTSVGALKASYHHAVTKIEKYINDF
ncbi:MAG: sigma-70 family RNA polymerase sigma factor [Bacteroidales bacterium]|jgi:RNA polymerase sigma-70 factor (ECF subfamily)|nr:sigma-70 family RNA polymerase sigma factor [Bacteroidales bacterium]